ncbi:unnamed protein product [Scytosiphon promiscuus]
MVFTKGKGSADSRLGRNGVAGSAGQAGAAAAPAAAAGGKKRSAVEDVLAALSLEGSEGSLGDPSKHMRQRSKMHEVEMDENNVVMHTRRGSTAVGVTPSDPSAIVDLFQEVESIGSTYIPEDETDDSTTDEDEGDSSCRTDPAGHAAASKNAAGDTGASGSQRQPSGGDSVAAGGLCSHGEGNRLSPFQMTCLTGAIFWWDRCGGFGEGGSVPLVDLRQRRVYWPCTRMHSTRFPCPQNLFYFHQ